VQLESAGGRRAALRRGRHAGLRFGRGWEKLGSWVNEGPARCGIAVIHGTAIPLMTHAVAPLVKTLSTRSRFLAGTGGAPEIASVSSCSAEKGAVSQAIRKKCDMKGSGVGKREAYLFWVVRGAVDVVEFEGDRKQVKRAAAVDALRPRRPTQSGTSA